MTVGRMDHKAGHAHLEGMGYTKDEAHVVLGGDEAKARGDTYSDDEIGQSRRDKRKEVEDADKDDEHNAAGEGSDTGDAGDDNPVQGEGAFDGGGDGGGDAGGGDGGGDAGGGDGGGGGGNHAAHNH